MKVINLIIFIFCILKIYSLDNGLGRTPQMGWNTWNKFGCDISAELIEQSIDFLRNSKLYDAGYKYINMDDCWQKEKRNDKNEIQYDESKFAKGIQVLAQRAHRNELLFGLYSDAGTKTCAGRAGSLDYEDIDAKTYVDWEIDYLKYDNCYNENRPAKERYTKMRDALMNAQTNRPIFYSICNWGEEDIPTWGKDVCNSWRTTGDISDMWLSMLRNIDLNDKFYEYAGPGGWNDPDMLEVGNGGMSLVEYKTHFSLWAISKAPLIIGCDITKMSKDIEDILTNSEVIAINQDSLGEQGRKIKIIEVKLPEGFTPSLYRSELEVVDCDGSNEQKWYINEDGSIRNNNENLCMEIPNCVEYDTKMKTDVCHIGDKSYCKNSTNQLWTYNSETKQISSQMSPEKCLDVYTHKLDGRSVQTYDCSDIETQKWEYNETDHVLKNGNKCLSSFKNNEVTEIWGGKLSDGDYAILLVNRASITSKIEVSWNNIGLFDEKKAKLRDLWAKKDLGEFEDTYSVLLESHDSQFLRVTPVEGDDNKLIYIVMIVLGAAIVISTIFVIAFYLKMKKSKPKSLDDNDQLIDSKSKEEE